MPTTNINLTIDKTTVGLGNVDNTSDVNKPVSTAQVAADAVVLGLAEKLANKDATGGYAGLTLFKINFKNVLNTITSFFTNSNTAARTYTFPDASGTVALTSDVPSLSGYLQNNLGIAGGTTLIGDTAANGSVTILGTSNGTKTSSKIILGTTEKVSIGAAIPTARLHLYSPTGGNLSGLLVESGGTGNVGYASINYGTPTYPNDHFQTGLYGSTATKPNYAFFFNNSPTGGIFFATQSINRFDIGSTGLIAQSAITSTTLAVDTLYTLANNSSGTPAAGYGAAITVNLKSNTTVDTFAGSLSFSWGVATHATRASDFKITLVNLADSGSATGYSPFQILQEPNTHKIWLQARSAAYSPPSLQWANSAGVSLMTIERAGTDMYLTNSTGGGGFIFRPNVGSEAMRLFSTGLAVKMGGASPTAWITIGAGIAAPGGAALKFTTGTNLTTPEAGAIEWDGVRLYATQTIGPTRKQLAYVTDLSSYVPYTGATNDLDLGSQVALAAEFRSGEYRDSAGNIRIQFTGAGGYWSGNVNLQFGYSGQLLFYNGSSNIINSYSNYFMLSDATGSGTPSVNVNDRELRDASNIPAIYWNERYALDSASITSLDWGNRRLVRNTGATSIDYDQLEMYDYSGATAAQWGSRSLFDQTGINRLDWENGILRYASGVDSVVWSASALLDTAGNTSVHWNGYQLSAGGITAIDWGSKTLKNNSGVLVADWDLKYLYHFSGSQHVILDWGSQRLFDNEDQTSLHWTNRQAYASDGGTIMLDWSTSTGSKFGKPIQIGRTAVNLVPTATLHLDVANATATQMRFTAGTTTGTTATDGFEVGITSTGDSEIRQRENLALSLYTGNVLRAQWTGAGNLFLGGTTQARGASGSAASPFWSFESSSDCGMFRSTGSTLGFSTTGTQRLLISAAGLWTFGEGNNFALGTTTGTKIGTATTQKIGFFNATPIVQPSSTVDIGDVLSNLGLRAAGYGFSFTMGGTFALIDGNCMLGTTTGTKWGTSTFQKQSFWNATPIAQPANTVAIDTLLVDSGLRASGGVALFDTDIKSNVVGKGLYIKEGTNATMGTATLVAGSIVVNTTKVTANSRIMLTAQGGTITNIGFQYISARTAGTSFTISSMNVLDASNVAWIIFEPA